ncbi:MAG: penicillin acylase family protein, partial [Alphaproteobacteria bacterium]
ENVLAAARRAAAISNPDDGSNGWVVAAARSTSGHALLANDPHLGLTAPGTWMLVSLKAPGFRLAGATAPGVPAVILGHNGRIAWGLTNAETDASDVYVETVDPADPDRYLAPDGPRPFETRRETIQVRFGRDREIVVRRTRHGPVVSDELDGAPAGTALALAHTGLLPHEASAEAIFRVNRAGDWPAFRRALGHAQAPQQNAFYAGPDGVGLVTMAALPIRRNGTGYMPADGRTTDGDWIGFAGLEAMPQTFRPARGWAANANNTLAADDYPIRLGEEWGYPGRIARIEEVLTAGGPFDLDALQALQLDDRSTIASALLPAMLEAVADAELSASAQGLIDRLGAWDGRTATEAAEPLVF